MVEGRDGQDKFDTNPVRILFLVHPRGRSECEYEDQLKMIKVP